jgi:adenine-specific DNA-methyltransferase
MSIALALEPYYADDAVRVYEADALDLLYSLPDASVQLVATDPPYFRVKDEAWDNAWPNERAFLRWIGQLCREWRRVLAPNGSLYVFASPQMAHGVERVVRRHFRVLNGISWRKEQARHKASEVGALRCYFPQTEQVIFAEQAGSDMWADDLSGWSAECAGAARDTFGHYITAVRHRHGLTMKDLTAAVGSHGAVNHGGACSNWERGYNVPTREHYDRLQEVYPGCFDREYEDLRREYEDLRREYEDLRRPFNATPDAPYTDVWDFPTVSQYPGKHPTEKPLAMFEHIVRLSSRPGDTVLDTFSGSGTTAEAARNLGRKAIVGDSDPHWVRKTAERVSQGSLLADMEAA